MAFVSAWGNPLFSVDRQEPSILSDEVIERFVDAYGFPRSGTGRLVFRNEDKGLVYKVPVSQAGIAENAAEVEAAAAQAVPVAAAHHATVLGVEVVVMELVEPINDPASYFPPDKRAEYEWVRTIDMWQVGLTRDGRVVAYDTGRMGEENARFQRWPSS